MFMQPSVEYGSWHVVETTHGTYVVPADLCDGTVAEVREYVEGKPLGVETRDGWGARLSAPGYMDCTDWTLHESEGEARACLVETYDLCVSCGEDSPEGELCEACAARASYDEQEVS